MARRVGVAFLSALLCAIVATACGSDGERADDRSATTVTEVVLRAERSLSASDAATVKRILSARLSSLGARGSIGVDGDRVVVRLTSGDASLVRLAAQRKGSLELRPVLSTRAPDGSLTVTDDPRPDRNAVLPEFNGNEVVALYIVNPAELDRSAVQSAQAAAEGGQGWVVNLELTPTAAVRFDEVAARFAGMQLAIVFDGVVVSAPTLQAGKFGGEAVISGDFDEREARSLAAALSADQLPVELTAAP